MSIQSLRDAFHDAVYRFRKRSLEDRIERAQQRKKTSLCVHLNCKLSRLRYDRMAYLSGRITRNCKLYLVK